MLCESKFELICDFQLHEKFLTFSGNDFIRCDICLSSIFPSLTSIAQKLRKLLYQTNFHGLANFDDIDLHVDDESNPPTESASSGLPCHCIPRVSFPLVKYCLSFQRSHAQFHFQTAGRFIAFFTHAQELTTAPIERA